MATTALFLKSKINDSSITADEMRRANLFLTGGVILASLIGYCLADNIYLAQFLTTDLKYVDDELVSRFCGVSADPNYYSSFVIFAIATNLFHFIYRPHISYIFYTVLLTIVGVLSLSKMYLLLLVVTLCLFLFAWIRVNGGMNAKGVLSVITIIICVLIGGNFIMNLPSVQLIFARMGESSSINEFTTGRADTWIEYICTICGSAEYFLVGVDSNSAIAGIHNTHNTILQIWWKLGGVGILFVFSWFAFVWSKCKKRNVCGVALLLTGCLGATFALDMLFFEQLFWFFIFCVLCKQVFSAEKKQKG